MVDSDSLSDEDLGERAPRLGDQAVVCELEDATAMIVGLDGLLENEEDDLGREVVEARREELACGLASNTFRRRRVHNTWEQSCTEALNERECL